MHISRPTVVIAVLAAMVLLIAVLGRLAPPDGRAPFATPIRSADLVIGDRNDGSVDVVQAGTGRLIETLPPATNGFLRVVLAGLVRERRREDMGAPSTPFRLTRWSDGRLTLDDAATGKLIELEAFGQSNEVAFGRLLDLSPPPPAR